MNVPNLDKNILKSKKFWSGVGTIAAMIATVYLPATVELQALIASFTAFIGYGVIKGFSAQDVEILRVELAKELRNPAVAKQVVNLADKAINFGEMMTGLNLPDELQKELLKRFEAQLTGGK